MGIIVSMMLVAGFARTSAGVASDNSADPHSIAVALVTQIASQGVYFFPPDEYGSALLFVGFYESLSLFPDLATIPVATVTNGTQPLLQFVEGLLDTYTSIPGLSPFIILHNASFVFDSAIGDIKGLFPIAYLQRALHHAHDVPAPDNATDMYIAELGAQRFILEWPLKLADGTFARLTGGPMWPPSAAPAYLWGDDQFMGLALLCRLATTVPSAERAALFAWVVAQATQLATYMQDPVDGLFFHGVRVNGSTPTHSCCKWGRANGWGLMSHVEVLTAAAVLAARGFPVLGVVHVQQAFKAHAAGVLAAQLASGFWAQVLDVPSTFAETSCTAMFVYALATGVSAGWLDAATYTPAIMRGWAAVATAVSPSNGTIAGICEGTGIEPNVVAYESRPTGFESSLNGGLGAVLRAAAAVERLLKL